MTLQKGEVRQTGIEVISQTEQDFIIDGADFEIVKGDGTVIESGTATVDGHKILMLFSAGDCGQYYIIFTYRIGPEILKAKIYVEVVQ